MRSRLVRALLGLVTLSLVAGVFTAFYLVHERAGWYGWQAPVPEVDLRAGQLARFRAGAAGGPDVAAEAPIVLVYHGIEPEGEQADANDVSPVEFARHMAMLRAAGYRTLTGQEFLDAIKGHPTPSRSVLVTFDDGAQSLWTYADPVLQRYGAHAVAFLITGHLRDRAGPYYLSWPEVRRMADTGRWTFGSHTRDSHERVAVDAQGTLGSVLANRVWTSDGRESMQEFRRRVDADLRGSVADIVRQGLPRPRLFAYPYSEASLPGQDPSALGYLRSRARALFDGRFTTVPRPEPYGPRMRAQQGRLIERLEVARSTSAADLLTRMGHLRPVPVRRGAPAGREARWVADDGRPAPVRTDGTGVTPTAAGTYLTAEYAPQATTAWVGYRVRAVVSGLAGHRTRTASLSVRVGSSRTVEVRLSAQGVKVTSGGQQQAAVEHRLTPSGSHALDVRVLPRRTVVSLDGTTYDDAPTVRSPEARGGIGISAFREDTDMTFPTFAQLSVEPLSP